jgi:hypothetical protein
MLKDAIATALALALLQAGGGWILRTDASQAAIAGVLLQKQSNIDGRPVERVIGYFSRKLSGAETRYPIRKKNSFQTKALFPDAPDTVDAPW